MNVMARSVATRPSHPAVASNPEIAALRSRWQGRRHNMWRVAGCGRLYVMARSAATRPSHPRVASHPEIAVLR